VEQRGASPCFSNAFIFGDFVFHECSSIRRGSSAPLMNIWVIILACSASGKPFYFIVAAVGPGKTRFYS